MTTKIANILQCYALGMGIKQISRSFELSRNTVRRYVRLFQECGIPELIGQFTVSFGCFAPEIFERIE